MSFENSGIKNETQNNEENIPVKEEEEEIINENNKINENNEIIEKNDNLEQINEIKDFNADKNHKMRISIDIFSLKEPNFRGLIYAKYLTNNAIGLKHFKTNIPIQITTSTEGFLKIKKINNF